jgi:hypothetical protein
MARGGNAFNPPAAAVKLRHGTLRLQTQGYSAWIMGVAFNRPLTDLVGRRKSRFFDPFAAGRILCRNSHVSPVQYPGPPRSVRCGTLPRLPIILLLGW